MRLYAGVLEDNTPVFEWLDDNVDAFIGRIPDYLRSLVPQIVTGGCSDASLERLSVFFRGQEQFATSLEKAELAATACIDRRRSHASDLERFLESRGGT